MSPESIVLGRLRAQRLVGQPYASEVEAVRGMLAVQAQDYPAAKWAIGQRVAGSTEAKVDRLLDEGGLIRTHVLRPTWHLVAPEDLRWLLALTGPRVVAGSAGRQRELGVDAEVIRRSRRILERELAGGRSLTRAELAGRLAAEGLDASMSPLTYILMDAELTALICSGPRRGRSQTYGLVEERVAPAAPRSREESLAELARRYIEGHGPSQIGDLSWWSGLTRRDARLALELASPPLIRERIGDRELWSAPGPRVALDLPVVHLLPNFDELLVAFRDRSDAVDPSLPIPLQTPFGLLSNVLVRNGLVVGTWRRHQERGVDRVRASPSVSFDPLEIDRLHVAVERLAAFLGRPVEVTASSVPEALPIEAGQEPVLSSGSPSGPIRVRRPTGPR
jgi:hypothetical protein